MSHPEAQPRGYWLSPTLDVLGPLGHLLRGRLGLPRVLLTCARPRASPSRIALAHRPRSLFILLTRAESSAGRTREHNRREVALRFYVYALISQCVNRRLASGSLACLHGSFVWMCSECAVRR